MQHDIFGIKIGGNSGNTERWKDPEQTFRVPIREVTKALGMPGEVRFCQYEISTKTLILKIKGET